MTRTEYLKDDYFKDLSEYDPKDAGYREYQEKRYREYYAQIVTESMKRHLKDCSDDISLESELKVFDGWTYYDATISSLLRKHGDVFTKSGRVCAIKEALLQIEEEKGQENGKK